MKNKYDARLFMFRTAVFEALIDGAFAGIAEEFPEFCDYKIHVGGLLVGLPFGLRELSQSEAMRIASLVIPGPGTLVIGRKDKYSSPQFHETF